ncbi:MAG TPA: hypothetical protein VME18_02095 [Acidobacteriaceae bacterium]|nr:hypothetical protein [Acidobacteriaceae bacterium]
MQSQNPGSADQAARAAVTGLLIAAPALMCFHGLGSCAVDPDVGWQLQSAVWMLQHHAFPHTDPFSRTETGVAWQDYSWLFDLMLLKLYAWLSLDGLVLYVAAMAAAIAAAIYRLVSRVQTDFTICVLLTVAALVSVSRDFTPRPWLFTILFFALELDILMQFRRTRRARILLWLPPLFALWGNIHIQFIDGLLVLGIAACEPLLARWTKWGDDPATARPLWLALGACVAAPLLNPYGIGIYRDAWIMASQPGVLNTVSEMHALAFRSAGDYLLLFLALAATALLFRLSRPAPFETLLLAMSVVLSFRSQRDAWILAIVAVALIAARWRASAGEPAKMPAWALPVTLAATAAVSVAGFFALHVNNTRMLALEAKAMPVQAVQVVKQRHYPGPLFNDYNWGGYLIWQLGLPVTIDGRAGLYGDSSIDRSVATWGGGPHWATNPQLQSAALVIAPVGDALTQLLRLDSRFELVYEDKVAAVFVRCPLPQRHAVQSRLDGRPPSESSH